MFSPYMVSEAFTGHPTLLAVGAVPIVFLLLEDIIVYGRRPPAMAGGLLGLAALCQLVTSEELLVDTLLIAGIGAGVLVMLGRTTPPAGWHHALASLAWAASVLPLGLAYVGYQLLGPGAIHGQPLDSAGWGAPLPSLFIPTGQQLASVPSLAGYVSKLWGVGPELGAYVGLPVVGLAIFTLLKRHDVCSKWILAMLCVCSVLSLGPELALSVAGNFVNVPLPEAIVNTVPVLRDLLPMRLALYTDVFAVLLVVRCTDRWMASGARLTASTWMAAAVVGWAPVLGVGYLTQSTPAFFTSTEGTQSVPAGETWLVLPYAVGSAEDRAMLWQAESGMRFKMPEGYGTRTAWKRDANPFGPALSTFNEALVELERFGTAPRVTPYVRGEARRYLRSHHVELIVLGPGPHGTPTSHFISRILEVPPVSEGGVTVWRVP
ncbi:MAG: hypothetical protein ACYDEA_03700 [Candidatus Dormibacteria bacterium]